jgi:hypothetical protein
MMSVLQEAVSFEEGAGVVCEVESRDPRCRYGGWTNKKTDLSIAVGQTGIFSSEEIHNHDRCAKIWVSDPHHDFKMPVDYNKLFVLLKRVVDAIDENKETRSPQVARLQLASVSLVCYVKEISVEILSDQIDAEEEMRRQERAELLTAQATESRVLDILDTAMKKLIRDIMVTTSELKQAAGETARGLEAREMFRAAAVDGAIQQARDGITECRTSRQMQQTQELLGLASAG